MTVARTRSFLAVAAVLLAFGCRHDARSLDKDLTSSDPLVRNAAVLRLGDAGRKDAFDALLAMLDDPDEAVRVNAIKGLQTIADPRAVPKIAPLATEPVASVRIAACQTLGSFGGPEAIAALEKALYDSDELVRTVAARALGDIDDPAALEVLIRVATQDESDRIRAHVVKVIGKRKAHDAVPRLEGLLGAESDNVRANAAWVLGGVGDASSLPVLERALDDPFFKVRCLAAHSISKLATKDEAGRAALEKRLAVESQPMTKVDIAWALVRLGDRSRLAILRDLLFTGSPEDVRAEAAIALGDVGEPSDVATLQKALSDKKGLVRNSVSESIEKLKGTKTS